MMVRFLAVMIGVTMQLEAELGVNTYKFGMIGAADTHTGLASAEEGSFLGKYAQDKIPENKARETVPGSYGWDAPAMGFAGVWATENTRTAIVEGFTRKEVYAATGPRIQLRIFAVAWSGDRSGIRLRVG